MVPCCHNGAIMNRSRDWFAQADKDLAHAKAAREIAAEYFDATKVLPRLVEESMNGRD